MKHFFLKDIIHETWRWHFNDELLQPTCYYQTSELNHEKNNYDVVGQIEN
jgi:hypothetical protein